MQKYAWYVKEDRLLVTHSLGFQEGRSTEGIPSSRGEITNWNLDRRVPIAPLHYPIENLSQKRIVVQLRRVRA